MRTLAELNIVRQEIEALILAEHRATTPARTDVERAERAERMHRLHGRLEDVFGEAELVASGIPALYDNGMVGALRWSVIGAMHTADWWRDSAIAWRRLAADVEGGAL